MDYSTDFMTHAETIVHLFTKTFSDSEGEEEGKLIGALVRRLIAETPEKDLRTFTGWKGTTLLGCICFSRLVYDNVSRSVFMMSPVAITPEYQRKGLGKKLISHRLRELKMQGIDILVTYGDPSFYNRVGFTSVSQHTLPPPHALQQPEGWIAQSLNGAPITQLRGPSSCVSAFNDPALW